MEDSPRLVLTPSQADDVLVALGEECAMEKRARTDQSESCTKLFRRVATTVGIASFQFHPQKLAGRVQTVILRDDLTLEVWEQNPIRRYEDFETTAALGPVRERLEQLALSWELRGPQPIRILLPASPRARLSSLAEHHDRVALRP